MKRSNKYGARKTIVDGITFASAKEAQRWCELKLLERGGAITELVRQPRFPMIIGDVTVCTYVADFTYRLTTSGKRVVEDAKGFKTDVYKLKAKLMKACHGVDVREV